MNANVNVLYVKPESLSLNIGEGKCNIPIWNVILCNSSLIEKEFLKNYCGEVNQLSYIQPLIIKTNLILKDI